VSELVVENAAQELPLERLEAEICELAGHLAAAECRWMVLLEEFDRREGWERVGGDVLCPLGGVEVRDVTRRSPGAGSGRPSVADAAADSGGLRAG